MKKINLVLFLFIFSNALQGAYACATPEPIVQVTGKNCSGFSVTLTMPGSIGYTSGVSLFSTTDITQPPIFSNIGSTNGTVTITNLTSGTYYLVGHSDGFCGVTWTPIIPIVISSSPQCNFTINQLNNSYIEICPQDPVSFDTNLPDNYCSSTVSYKKVIVYECTSNGSERYPGSTSFRYENVISGSGHYGLTDLRFETRNQSLWYEGRYYKVIYEIGNPVCQSSKIIKVKNKSSVLPISLYSWGTLNGTSGVPFWLAWKLSNGSLDIGTLFDIEYSINGGTKVTLTGVPATNIYLQGFHFAVQHVGIDITSMWFRVRISGSDCNDWSAPSYKQYVIPPQTICYPCDETLSPFGIYHINPDQPEDSTIEEDGAIFFPNPTTGILHVNIEPQSGQEYIAMVNIRDRYLQQVINIPIWVTPSNSTYEINITDILPSGTYYFSLINGSVFQNQIIIKTD